MHLKKDFKLEDQDFEILPFVRLTLIVPTQDYNQRDLELDEKYELEKYNKYAYGAYCSNSNIGYSADFEKGAHVRIIEIRLSNQYFNHLVNKSTVLKGIMSLDNPIFFYEEINIIFRCGINYFYDLTKEEFYRNERVENVGRALITNFFMSMDNRQVIDEPSRYSFNITTTLKAQKLVNNAYNKVLSMDDICKEVGLSESRLRSLFRQTFGISIMNYYQDYRLQKSKEMLCEPNVSISNVALDLGFNSTSHFAQVFKKKFSITPKEFIEYYTEHLKKIVHRK